LSIDGCANSFTDLATKVLPKYMDELRGAMKDLRPLIGISRGVIARLRQHGTGSTHFDASLAYSMARHKVPHKLTRSAAMKNPTFRQAFEEAQRLLISCRVAFIEIQNSLELYLFEAYCAMEFDTCKWNTFRTH
jgi:hypothetical protein